jgi:hypothetical protein
MNREICGSNVYNVQLNHLCQNARKTATNCMRDSLSPSYGELYKPVKRGAVGLKAESTLTFDAEVSILTNHNKSNLR